MLFGKTRVPVPPSLRNIYRELETDVGFDPPGHGFLQAWAQQGVLLLNSVLTVRANQAGSHQGKGWERFTDRIVASLSQHKEALVFLLWEAMPRKRVQWLIETDIWCCSLSTLRRFLPVEAFLGTGTSRRRIPICSLTGNQRLTGNCPRRQYSGKHYD